MSEETPQVPTGLRSAGTLVIHTRHAHRLVMGRKGDEDEGIPKIPGLNDFSMRTRLLCQASAADDPYADWFLIRIEESLEEAKTFLRKTFQECQEKLSFKPTVRLHIAQAVQPVEVQVDSSTPYGFLAAFLLADFDDCARAVLSLRHYGLLTRDQAEGLLDRAAHLVRRTYALAFEWKPTAVTRKDLEQQNQLAERARKLMGSVPEEVRARARRPHYAPAAPPPRPGPEKTEALVEALAGFLQANAQRFPPLGADGGSDPLGWYEETDRGRVYLLTSGVLQEAVGGNLKIADILDRLQDAGVLQVGGDARRSRPYRINGQLVRLYCVSVPSDPDGQKPL